MFFEWQPEILSANYLFFSCLLESKSEYFFTRELFDDPYIVLGIVKFFDTFCLKNSETTQVLLAIFKFLRAIIVIILQSDADDIVNFEWWRGARTLIRQLEDLEKNFNDEALETRIATSIIVDLKRIIDKVRFACEKKNKIK